MARAKKLNITRQQPIQHWKVQITVDDPACVFSMNPSIAYKKVFKATNAAAAVRAAATYCNAYMKQYAGTQFKHSTQHIEPYRYIARIAPPKDNL